MGRAKVITRQPSEAAMTEQVASLSVRVGAETSDARQKLKELERLGDSFGRRV